MTFDNIKLKDLGIIVQFVHGVLDMPKREGATDYDWGDVVEPLVSADDIYFGSRDIIIDALFDERYGDFKTTSDRLNAITQTRPLVTEYGTYQVRLDGIQVVKHYKGGKTLKIKFVELNPDLSAELPTSSGSGGVRLDGYDLFVQFGLLVEQATLYEIQQLKNSKETSYKNNFLSIYRKPQELNVKVNGIYASKAEMTTKITQLNALLVKDNLRYFYYRGEEFHCYAVDGHSVKISRNRVEINLKLQVSIMYNFEDLKQKIIDEINIQVNPQSDLSTTDTTDPAYIKGKDTFKAADSDKLDGHDSLYFAKESELADARMVDATLNTKF